MTTTENRLRDALAARADQVQAEDLRPAAAPTALPTRGRRPALYAAAAAVVAGVMIAPVLIGNDDPASTPAVGPGASNAPTASPSTSPTPSGTDVTDRFFPTADGPIGSGRSFERDLDDDGKRDLVTLVERAGGAQLVVDLAGGGELSHTLEGEGEAADGVYPDRIDVSNTFEGVLTASRGDGVTSHSLVMLVSGVLTQLVTVGVPSRLDLGTGVLPDGGAYETWIGPEGELFTRVQAPDSGQSRDGETQRFFRWTMTDELFGGSDENGDGVYGLTPSRVGDYCVEPAAESDQSPTVTECG